jgi:hypothetical protein
MIEMRENQAILNEELERHYGRGATLLCESAQAPGAERREPAAAAVAVPAAASQAATPAGPSPAQAHAPAPLPRTGPGPDMVQRIVELFDGEVLAPGAEGGTA